MESRIKMSSLSLQENFHAVYQDFFNRHDIVLSGNGILTWWADISHGISSLRIKQKLPSRTFIGVNFNDAGKISFGKIQFFSSLDMSFKEGESTVFSKNSFEKAFQFLENFLVQNGFSRGVSIDILTEAPKWHGFSFDGVLSVLLTYLVHILVGKIHPDDLTNDLPEGEKLERKPVFEKLFQFSQSLSHCISNGKSSGSDNFAVMMTNHSLPVLYITKKNDIDPMNKTFDSSDNATGKNAVDVGDDSYSFKNSLFDFLGVENRFQELPFDYGVLFTGVEYTHDDVESVQERMRRENEKLDIFIAETINNLGLEKKEKNRLLDLLVFDKNEEMRQNIDFTNLKILEWFNYLVKNPYDEGAITSFIRIIKNIGLMSFSYQRENKLFFAIQYLFYKYRQFEDEELGILPYNSGKIGGSFFFVLKNNKSRATLSKVLDQLQQDGFVISTDYLSWRDGYSSNGVQLEQYISQKRYSEYAKQANVSFSDNAGGEYFGDYQTVVENENDCILLDTVQWRIYIRGTKLTSKDIHSQNTTIDMMKILLENLGKEVPSSMLPVSTYSQNKNEILGKVVLPIRKLSKKYFGKEIPLICSGGITDYYLKLEKDDSVRIGLLKKTRD